MATITVNNQNYDSDTFSDEAKAQLTSIQFVDAELQRLNAQISVLRTARAAYGNALQASLTAAPPPLAGDTLKFN